jgi:hypothetical protein
MEDLKGWYSQNPSDDAVERIDELFWKCMEKRLGNA